MNIRRTFFAIKSMSVRGLIRAIVLLSISWSLSALPAAGACNLANGATMSFVVSPLIDNHQSTVTISLSAASSGDYVFSLSAAPVQQGTLINNNKGTAITFTETANPLVWDTSKVYWYGLDPSDKCYNFVPDYKFTLTATGLADSFTCEVKATVSWPNENPEMEPSRTSQSESIVHDAEAVPGIADYYRCLIEFQDYGRRYAFNGLPTSDQYSAETTLEEQFHADQWMGIESTDEGGSGDLFTARGIKWALSMVGVGPWYVYAFTATEAESLAEQLLLAGEIDEESISKIILKKDEGFRELKAKEHADYNAAFTYECTYQKTFGPNPTNYEHPAYQ